MPPLAEGKGSDRPRCASDACVLVSQFNSGLTHELISFNSSQDYLMLPHSGNQALTSKIGDYVKIEKKLPFLASIHSKSNHGRSKPKGVAFLVLAKPFNMAPLRHIKSTVNNQIRIALFSIMWNTLQENTPCFQGLAKFPFIYHSRQLLVVWKPVVT